MIMDMDSNTPGPGEVNHFCAQCQRQFSHNKNLYAHIRKFHPNVTINYKRKAAIICCMCDLKLMSMASLHEHFGLKHAEVKLCFERKQFYCETDFINWKKTMERESQSRFATLQSEKEMVNGKTSTHFGCNRSGVFKPAGLGRRPLKRFVTKKIGKTCPAYLSVYKTTFKEITEFDVSFQSVHVGHKLEIDRFSSKKKRSKLTTRVAEIKKRHIDSLELSVDCVTEMEPCRYWIVASSKLTDVHLCTYDVRFKKECPCKIRCSDCNICIHKLSCNCDDYTISFVICKHIHLVCRYFEVGKKNLFASLTNENNDSLNIDSGEKGQILEEEENHVLVKEIQTGFSSKSIEAQQSELNVKFQALLKKCQTPEQLRILREAIDIGEVELSVNSANAYPFPEIPQQIAKQLPNKNMPQRHLLPVKLIPKPERVDFS